MARIVITAALLVGGVALVGSMAWPGTALLIQCWSERGAVDPHASIGARQLVLLLRTLALVVGSTIPALLMGLGAAPSLTGRFRHTSLLVCLVVLFCPPMVYAFGWQRVLPAAIEPHVGCMLVWTLWSWPIAALMLAGGLGRVADSYQAALLSTGRARAFVLVVVPSIVPELTIAGLAIAVLLLGEYTTPHAFGLVVYATELLGWATSSPQVVDAGLAAIPLGGLILVLSALMYAVVRCHHDAAGIGTVRGETPASLVFLLGLGLVAAGAPLGALAAKLSGPHALPLALHTYGHDIWCSIAVGAAAALATVAIAILVGYLPRWRGAPVALTMAFGLLPGALVGEALVAAYNGPRLAWAYDQWPIVALAYVARFGWLGALAGCLVGRDLRGGLGAQASVDGAGRTAGMFYISLPRHAALLGGIGMTVLALSLAEVASTSMVRVPAFSPISQVIIEKFHRFEDDMLISLSFVLIAASVLGAVLVARAGRRFDSRW